MFISIQMSDKYLMNMCLILMLYLHLQREHWLLHLEQEQYLHPEP
uniref:Uncharacterized protein n=1 Tax=Setaria italica TaxID=4555 RepID=K3XUJ7_SETIT